MTVTDRLFFAYMALVGLAAGGVLIKWPSTQGAFVPPFFWVLLAVAVFEFGGFFLRQTVPAAVLTTNGRIFGFLIGVGAMLGLTLIAGVKVNFF